MAAPEAWIVAAVRTPIGKHGGVLSSVRPDDLAALALRGVLERANVPAAEIEDVVLGCANGAGEDNRNVARMAALLAGFPDTVPGTTVNRLCGSGLDAVAHAARALLLGEGDVYLAGGVESMSRAPWVLPKTERPFPSGHSTLYDTTLGWRMANPRMEALGHTDALGVTAEHLAVGQHLDNSGHISRTDQDRFALASHQRAVRAMDAGRFADELVPVPLATRKGETLVTADEGPRRDTSLEQLAALKPAFQKGGTVTAGNSSSLNDGAAALLLVSKDYAQAHRLQPLARVRGMAVAGVPPRWMGIGPLPATAKALERAGLALADIGLIELNEAFAAQSLAVLRGWGLADDDPRVNVNGGALALGHPLGCSGARILTTLLHEMRRRGTQFGLATMCIGVGQGIAMVVEQL